MARHYCLPRERDRVRRAGAIHEGRGNDWKGAAGGAKRSEHGTPEKRDGDVRSRAAQKN